MKTEQELIKLIESIVDQKLQERDKKNVENFIQGLAKTNVSK